MADKWESVRPLFSYLRNNLRVDDDFVKELADRHVISGLLIQQTSSEPSRQRAKSILLEAMKNNTEEAFESFLDCLRNSCQAEVAQKIESNLVDTSADATSPSEDASSPSCISASPSIGSIHSMDFKHLRWLSRKRKLNVDEKKVVTVAQFRDAVCAEIMKDHGSSLQLSLKLSSLNETTTEEKYRAVIAVIDQIEQFALKAESLLQSLNIVDDDWFSSDTYYLLRKEITDFVPTLLVAGSTSAGKSTLLNALIGDNIMPTSYNAATSVICEVKYAERKKGVIYLENSGGSENRELECDLESGALESFSAYLDQHADEGDCCCQRAQLFWPADLLKDFTVADSPGVTDSGTARIVTEEFYRTSASGVIYVLDPLRSAEECTTVVGLLEETIERSSASRIIFVFAKWNKLCELGEDTEEHLRIVRNRLESVTGSKTVKIITMNAKLALLERKAGQASEIQPLLDAIAEILPACVNIGLEKCLRKAMPVIEKVRSGAIEGIRTLLLNAKKEPVTKSSEDESGLQSKINSLKNKIDFKLKKLTEGLASHLRSNHLLDCQCLKRNVFWRLFTYEPHTFLKRQVALTLVETVYHFKGLMAFFKWAREKLPVKAGSVLHEIKSAQKRDYLKSSDDYTETEIDLDKELRSVVSSEAIAFSCAVEIAPIVDAYTDIAVDELNTMDKPSSFKESLIESVCKRIVSWLCEGEGKVLSEFVTSVVKACVTGIRLLLDVNVDEFQAGGERADNLLSYKMISEWCYDVEEKLFTILLNLSEHEFAVQNFDGLFVTSYSCHSSIKASLPHLGDVGLREADLGRDKTRGLYQEISVFRNLIHENVVKFHGSMLSGLDTNVPRLWLVFEWCPTTLANELLTRFTRGGIKLALERALQLWNGVKYLHQKEIVHGDLRPENILISDSNRIKIASLGSAKHPEQIDGTESSGNLFYTSPEALQELPYSYPSDVYSIGIILWELLNSQRAYSAWPMKMTVEEFSRKIVDGSLRPKTRINIAESSTGFWALSWDSFTKICWNSNPDKRPSASMGYDAFLSYTKRSS